MKKLSKTALAEVRLWVRRNAQALDMALWHVRWDHEDPRQVIDCLRDFQNADGGFGHAVEADNWDPHSTPANVDTALRLLASCGVTDGDEPLIRDIIHFLRGGIGKTPYGWRFAMESTEDWPHAPWWSYDPKADEMESIGLTSNFCALLLRVLPDGDPLRENAASLTEMLLDKLLHVESFGDMGLEGLSHLVAALDTLPEGKLYDLPALRTVLLSRADSAIVRDPSKWPYYGVRPSGVIRSPEHPLFARNADIVNAELDFLIDTRPESGVWPITWTWFDNTAKYPAQFAVCENWWKSLKALENMEFLRAFGRIEE